MRRERCTAFMIDFLWLAPDKCFEKKKPEKKKAEGQSDERYFSFVAVQETEIREPGAWQAEYYQLSSNIDLANQSSGLCAPHELNSRRMRFLPRMLACSLLLSSGLHDHNHH